MFPQSTLLDPIFWMGFAILQVYVYNSAVHMFKVNGIKLTGLSKFLLLGWWVSLLLTVAGSFTLLGENEGNAGWLFLGTVSPVLIAGGAILFSWIVKMNSRTSN